MDTYKDVNIYIVPLDYIPPIDHLKYTYEDAIKSMWDYNPFINDEPPKTFTLEYFTRLKIKDPADYTIMHKSFGILNLKKNSILIHKEYIPHPILKSIEKSNTFFMWTQSTSGIDFVRKWKLW